MHLPVLWIDIVDPPDLRPKPGTWVVVVDVLRATTTIQRALENGAQGVLPVADLGQALGCANELGRDQVVLCGEREGLAPEGFDRGNSPEGLPPELVGGKPVVITTTNGTAALAAARGANRVLTACFPNRSAVARRLVASLTTEDAPCRLEICCAGRRGGSGEDDELFAASLLHALRRTAPSARLELGTRARRALSLWNETLEDVAQLHRALQLTEAGAWLTEIGFEQDVRAAASLDDSNGVPVAAEEFVAGQLRQVLRFGDPESDPPRAPADAR